MAIREIALTPREQEEMRAQRNDNALNDYYGGTANIPSPRSQRRQVEASRRWARAHPRPPSSSESNSARHSPIPTPRPPPQPSPAPDLPSLQPSQTGPDFPPSPPSPPALVDSHARPQPPPPETGSPVNSPGGIIDEPDKPQLDRTFDDGFFFSEPPDGDWGRGKWGRAARKTGLREGDVQVLPLTPTLILKRHGRRFESEPFAYEKGWTDERLAQAFKTQYARLKLKDVGVFQKIVAYKQIAYVIVLQSRCLKEENEWVIAKSVPITTKGDKEGRDAFMYLLRYPTHDRRWTKTVDSMIKPGVIIYFEVIETFDPSMINVGVLLAGVLSLGVALAYGFTMDGDFSTGFSIASWLITAFGFFAALVSISEFAGQESLTSVQTDEERLIRDGSDFHFDRP